MSNANSAFEGIALALSGGGYRAAAFHLGTLKMLHKLGLNTQMRALSTISGGTIVGAAYAKSLSEEKPFDEFADEFRSSMRSTNVITEALGRLPDTRTINGLNVMPSIIRAAANIYEQKFYGKATIGDLNNGKSSLKEISFNATEFKTGKAFRFQTGTSNRQYSGNSSLRIGLSTRTNQSIRLADVVAASSCFPSGFEPIRFPSGFVWGADHNLSKVRAELGSKFEKEIPLMDGGVYDNQGIESLVKYY